MSRGQRIGLVVVAAVAAAVAFAVAKPGDDGNESTAPTTRIRLKGHKPVGGPRSITARKGDRVAIVVSSDTPDQVHLHGYDIERRIGPGKPAKFAFRATNEGAFDMESHETEARIATLRVGPR